jgi:hypothetical protein
LKFARFRGFYQIYQVVVTFSAEAIILTALTRLKVLPVVAEGDSNVIDHFPWALCGGGLSFFFASWQWQDVSTVSNAVYRCL